MFLIISLYTILAVRSERLRDVTCEELRLARGILPTTSSATTSTHAIAYVSSLLVATLDDESNALALASAVSAGKATNTSSSGVPVTLKTLAFDASDDVVGVKLFGRKLAVERRRLANELRDVSYFARLVAMNESCGDASSAVLEAVPIRLVDVARQMRQETKVTMCVGLAAALQTSHLLEVLERSALGPLAQCAWRTEALALTDRYELKLLDVAALAAALPDLPFGADQRCDVGGEACATHLACLRDAGVGGSDVATPLELQCVSGLCTGFDARSNVWGAGVAVFQPLFRTPGVARVLDTLGADARALALVIDDMLEPTPNRRPTASQLRDVIAPLYERWRASRECAVRAQLPTLAALDRRRDDALALIEQRQRGPPAVPPAMQLQPDLVC
jgi:hypothetical protein